MIAFYTFAADRVERSTHAMFHLRLPPTVDSDLGAASTLVAFFVIILHHGILHLGEALDGGRGFVIGLILLGVVPLINLLASIAQIVIACIPGTVGENKYGPDPKGPVASTSDVFV